jgi:hypothetical protein
MSELGKRPTFWARQFVPDPLSGGSAPLHRSCFIGCAQGGRAPSVSVGADRLEHAGHAKRLLECQSGLLSDPKPNPERPITIAPLQGSSDSGASIFVGLVV